MTPTFDITFQGRSLFNSIQPFLVSLSLTDEPGLKSDRLDLVLASRNLELPQTGEVLSVRLGYKETGLFDMGTFVIDGYTLTATELRVTAHAANFLETIKHPRSRTFTHATLEEVVRSLAADHGIETKIAALPNVLFPTLQQVNESDLHFLSRLAMQYNLLLKPAGGKLVAMTSGDTSLLPAVTVRPDSVLSWSYQLAKRDATSSVTVTGYDIDEASAFQETAGDAEQTGTTLRGTYATHEEAQAAAQALYAKLSENTQTFSAEIVGDPAIMAEVPIVLEGFPSAVPLSGRIIRTTHSLTTSGYRTSLEAALKNTGDALDTL